MLFSFCSCAFEKGEEFSSTATSFQTQTSGETTVLTETVSSFSAPSSETTFESAATEVPTETTARTTETLTAPGKTSAEKPTTESTAQKEPASTEKTTEEESVVCFVTIDCRNVQNNLSSLKKGKRSFVPESGFILKDAEVTLSKGSTAFDALKKACEENVCTDNCKYCQKDGIQLEFSYTPAYKSYYVEGIHQLYEKDCGSLSGWMYNVDGTYPDVSSSAYNLEGGEKITFAYTVSMGDDLAS